MTDFLKDQLQAMDARLKELKPLHEEYLKLERAKAALEGLDAAPAKRRPGRPRGSTSSGNGRRRRRRRQGGTRAQQALEVVRQQPGVSVRELSEKLGVKHPNYMYRVMNELEGDGSVKKEGRGYVAA
ncbi:MAG TPA: hypothetical protein VK304_09755 [Thermoleophilaceae bacterium]|nr:hypothetical protein [Thermoleophilaceae bacterium]